MWPQLTVNDEKIHQIIECALKMNTFIYLFICLFLITSLLMVCQLGPYIERARVPHDNLAIQHRKKPTHTHQIPIPRHNVVDKTKTYEIPLIESLYNSFLIPYC